MRIATSRSRFVTIGATLVALGFIVYLTLHELRALRDVEVERFRGHAIGVTDVVDRYLGYTEASLRAVIATLEASQTLNEGEFEALVEGLGLFEDGNHLRAIGLLPVLSADEVPEVNRRLSLNVDDRGAYGYGPWTPIALEGQDVYAPVIMALSPDGVPNKVGYDMATSADRMATAWAARDAKDVRMTAPLTLSQDEDAKSRSVLLVGFTEKGRLGYRDALKTDGGFPTIVVIGYSPGKHLDEIFRSVNIEAFGIEVRDVTNADSPVLIYGGDEVDDWPTIHTDLIEIAGRVWSIEFRKELPPLISFASGGVLWTALLGALMVMFCGFAAYRISQNESVLQRRVAQRTAELEEARDQLNAALREAERANHAKTEFLATMSHEFRTPLNAILGFSDVIQNQIFGEVAPSRYQHYARDIHESGKHMLQLVNDILDLSAIEAGALDLRFEPIDLSKVVRDLSPIIREVAAGHGSRVHMELSDALPSISADPRSMKQIIMNLVSNAVKYSAAGTQVDVITRATDTAVQFEVRDRGVGIPRDKIERILKPFVRGVTDPHISAEGAGLGLSIVNVLIAHHNGTLTIDSAVNEGTTVTVSLPLE